MLVHWSNSTRMEVEIEPTSVPDPKLVVDGRLEVDIPEPEVVYESLTNNETQITDNGRIRINRLLPAKAWNRTMCSTVLPECSSE